MTGMSGILESSDKQCEAKLRRVIDEHCYTVQRTSETYLPLDVVFKHQLVVQT
jgi:hypothetical protein